MARTTDRSDLPALLLIAIPVLGLFVVLSFVLFFGQCSVRPQITP